MEKQRILLGKRIQKLRESKNLTQEELAEKVNRSTNHISKLETAKTNPSFELLVSVAKALNLEMIELFNFAEYNNIEFIEKELSKLINSKNEKDLILLYKIYKNILY